MTRLRFPAPVQRYFDNVLPGGEPTVYAAQLAQEGEFLLRPPNLWRPFTATHRLTMAPVGFVWNARIRVIPGVAVHVRDALSYGVGSIHAKVFGVFTLASMHGTSELALGSLQRYLAEAPWCPPALLPSNGAD
jgi:hypothetical protein